ncbi:MAG TPA: MerR family transcriptional regulator [Promineifilum sp.]|nr:MerR family transcriptional regulator [Promineifilum sp.]
MTYTVKQLADLAGVTARTLHYYDEIGLLPPSCVAENGYRRYDDAAVLRLQQVLFYRELGLSLNDIRDALDRPDFDVIGALRSHREALQGRAGRLNHLIHTIDRTLRHLEGQIEMSSKDLFEGFDEETQAGYEQEAAEMYDPQLVAESSRRWKSYTAEDKARVMAEGGAVYRDLAAMIDRDPADATVQAAIGRWHQHLRSFYEPTPDILRGLGQSYTESPEFTAFFAAMHPDLPDFLRRAIEHYVDDLDA